ncbi:hypothetical protein [Borreliella turdi]|nr:hypothetical protein [Borreliella turdi]
MRYSQTREHVFLVKNHYTVFQEISGEFQNAIAIDVERCYISEIVGEVFG